MRQIVNIQGLRAVAVLLVVAAHAHDLLDRFGIHSIFRTLYDLEAWGVDLFFVISGFVMISVHWEDFGVPRAPAHFLLRRVLRIFPMYWLVTIVIFLIIKLAPGQVHTWPKAEANFFLSLLLLVPHGQSMLLWLGWTLVFEMYFYYVFAAALFFSRQIALSIIMIWSAVIFSLQFVRLSENLWYATLSSDLVLEFVLGMCVGALVVKRRLLPTPVALGAICVAIVSLGIAFHFVYNPNNELSADTDFRFLKVGLPMALLVFSAVSLEFKGVFRAPMPLRYVGDASYSIYLTHPLFYVALGRVVALVFRGHVPAFMLTVGVPILVVLCGCAVFRWVERPVLRWSRLRAERILPNTMRSLTRPAV